LTVDVVDGNVEKALRRLKQQLRFGQPPVDLRRPDHYEKPSQRRRRKQQLAKRRHRQKLVRLWTEDRYGFRGDPVSSRRLEWVRWAEETCQCETCRWLRAELEPPAHP